MSTIQKGQFGEYDPDIQMFKETLPEPDLHRLKYLRWLGEQGRLEHPIAGLSSGPFSDVIQEERQPQYTGKAA